MASTSTKKSEVLVICNTQQAQKQLEGFKQQLKTAKTELDKLTVAGKTGTERWKELDREVKNLSKTISLNQSNMKRVQNTLNDLSNASLRQVTRAYRDLKKEMQGMSANSPGLKKAQADLQKLQAQIQKLKGDTVTAGNSMSSAWKKTAMAVTSYLGVTMMLGKVKQMMTGVINLNLRYSDQLADIRKVSGLTTRDIDKLAVNLSKIDTRTSIQEMSSIAYAGAKLGMGKYGIEGLESFVNAANQVNVALKEDLGADALTALSKMVEVMGLIPKMGVEQSLLATGSAMFKLASTSTADAGSIVEFSKRLTGMARAANITTDQLLALGSASSSMALMPEVSATAFNKLIASMQTKHNLIEDELNIEPGTISKLFQAGKLVDAMVLVFERMHERGNMNALQSVFKDLGSEGVRLVNVMVTMAQNVDMLKEHLQTSKDAFEEGTAVTAEYNIQQDTAQALMERASHTWEKAFVNPEGVDSVKSMAKAWYDLSNSLTKNSVSMGLLKGVFSALLVTIKAFLFLVPVLATALMFRGVAGAVIGIRNAFIAMQAAMATSTVATNSLTAAWHGLNAAQKANVFTAVLSVVLTLAVAIADLASKTKSATGYMEGFDSSLRGVKGRIAEVRSEALRYKQAIDKANVGTRERAVAIKNFNDKFGKYYKNMLTEKSTALDIAKAYKEVCKQLERKAVLELKEKDIAKQYTPRVGWAAQKSYDYGELAEGAGYGQYNSSWLKGVMEDKNYSTSGVVRALAGRLGLTEKDIQTAIDYRSYATIPTQVFSHYEANTKATSGGAGGPTSRQVAKFRTLTAEQRMLIAAARATEQAGSAQHALRKINEKYEPWTDMLAEEPEGDNDLNNNLENEAPDKEALKAAKAAAAERRKQLRAELKEAQDQAKAVMDNVKNFYERQITKVLETANENGWDQQLLQSATDAIVARENQALEQVRLGIAGQKNVWEDFKKEMKSDMIEQADEVGYNQSQELLNEINSSNIAALRAKIMNLDKELGIPNNASIDAIWKNATLNAKANETAEQKRIRARNAKLLEDNYTRKVDDDYSNSMTQLGYFGVNLQQSQTLANGGTSDEAGVAAKALLERRAADIEKVFTNVREHLVELINIEDVTTWEGKDKLLSLILGPDWLTAPTELKELLDMSGEDMRLFYDELIKYSNDYTDAQKKAHDRQKELLDFRWQRTATYSSNMQAQKLNNMAQSGVAQHDANLSQEEKDAMPYKDQYGTKQFISSLGDDPEVLAYQLKMEAAAAFYDFLKAHNADAKTLRDAEHAILTAEMDYAKSVASQMKQRLEDVYGLAEPIEAFGTSIGEAFATMTQDAEAGRAAVKAAIGDMINAFLKQTVTMTQEFIKRRIMQEANDLLTSTQMKKAGRQQVDIEKDNQRAITDAAADGGKEKLDIFKDTFKAIFDTGKKNEKKLVKQEADTQEAVTATAELGGEAQKVLNEDVKGEILDVTQNIGQQTLQVQQTQTQQEVQTESAKTQANTTMGIASGAAKIIGSLGWWGIPLVAVITALLNGLLSFAMSKVSSLFGGGSEADAGQSAKLVTGMLTYDSGNVQAFRGVEDGKSYPVVGNDGHVYAAKDGGELSTGLVKDPITTLVNGQPALVAERGPEMVIGRETTAAMMMARPDILAEIVKFDRARSGRTYKAYDEGNASDFNISVAGGGMSAEDAADLRSTINTLATVLATIQAKGLSVNKYGRGGIVQSAEDGKNFMRKNSGDRLWR